MVRADSNDESECIYLQSCISKLKHLFLPFIAGGFFSQDGVKHPLLLSADCHNAFQQRHVTEQHLDYTHVQVLKKVLKVLKACVCTYAKKFKFSVPAPSRGREIRVKNKSFSARFMVTDKNRLI